MTFAIQMNDDKRKQNMMYRRWNSTSTSNSDSGGSSFPDAENPNDVTFEETDEDEDTDSNDEIESLLIKTHGSDDSRDDGNDLNKEGEDYGYEDDDGSYYGGNGHMDKESTITNLKIRRNYNDDNNRHEQLRRPQQSSSASSSSNSFILNILNRNIFPDKKLTLAFRSNTTIEVLDVNGVKLLKFFVVTIMLILLIHYVAQFMDSERDTDYSIQQMILYDMNHISLDIIVFFVIGRLYNQRGVDYLSWIVPTICSSSLLLCGATRFPSLRHTFTAYDIHCLWTWQMWIIIIGIFLPLVVGTIGKHIHHAAYGRNAESTLLQKLFELGVTLLIWFVPYMSHPFFHLHHWYYAWLFGMHCNFNVWWSKLTMSILWGIYIHGIAVWGRDPILSCAVSLYRSQNGQCPFLVSDDYTLEALTTVSGTGWETTCDETIDYVP